MIYLNYMAVLLGAAFWKGGCAAAVVRKFLWLLLEFLVANRLKDLSLEQITEAVWNDEEESDNPANALKNLVYRARTILRELCPKQAADYIVFSRNTYLWNRDLPCTVD